MNKTAAGVGALALILVLGGAGVVSAHTFGPRMDSSMGDHEAARAAIENNDYEAFVAAHNPDAPILDRITEQNFEAFITRLQEKRKNASHMRMHKGFGDKHKTFADALEQNDFAAFLEVLPDNHPLRELITEDNFDQFVELHELHTAGDHDAARALAKSLGLPSHPHRGLR